MAGNSFGQIFKITSFGESHGKGIGVIIDGCPPGLDIDLKFIQLELDRRKPGQSKITTQRKEDDEIEVLSGIFESTSTGTPIALLIKNKDQKSKDYSHIASKFRPSHADFTYHAKYGIRDYRGGGRSSARETASRVAAGAIAKLLLRKYGIQIHAYVSQIGGIAMAKPFEDVVFDNIEQNIVRCPEPELALQMIDYVKKIRKLGDSVGGRVSCIVNNCLTGLGEPVFSKLHADLGGAMLGINACKGFEIGSGFASIKMLGSEHNDLFYNDQGKIRTRTNYSGGIQGGISNGMDIYFNVAFKPVATIMKDQKSIDENGEPVIVSGKGRHDPCVVPRAVPIVEAMTALVLVDHILRNKTLV